MFYVDAHHAADVSFANPRFTADEAMAQLMDRPHRIYDSSIRGLEEGL